MASQSQLINPRKKLYQELLIVGVGILLLGSITVTLGYYMQSRADSITKKRLVAITKTTQMVVLSQLVGEYARVAPYMGKLQSILPKQEDIIDFDRTMTDLAKKQQVGFGFTFGGASAASASTAGWIDFTITLQGSLTNITNYLDSLAKLPYFVSFPSVDMSIQGEQYSMRLNGKVFVQ
jgi:Tfp pilus assembly protein PilO